jgi:hypothetical protein
MSFNSIILTELDKEKFNKNVIANLDVDDYYDGCETTFKDVLVLTLIQMIHEIVEKNGWDLQYFSKEEAERLFIAFMMNTHMTVRLNKSENDDAYYFKKIPVVFNFSEEEKKKIAEIYLNNLFNYPSYFENCIIENPKQTNIDLLASLLSIQVHQLLSSEEIKTKFKDKIEKIINNE